MKYTKEQKEAILLYKNEYSLDISKGFGWYTESIDPVIVVIYPLDDETCDLDMGSAVEPFIGSDVFCDKFDEEISTVFNIDVDFATAKKLLSHPIFKKVKKPIEN